MNISITSNKTIDATLRTNILDEADGKLDGKCNLSDSDKSVWEQSIDDAAIIADNSTSAINININNDNKKSTLSADPSKYFGYDASYYDENNKLSQFDTYYTNPNQVCNYNDETGNCIGHKNYYQRTSTKFDATTGLKTSRESESSQAGAVTPGYKDYITEDTYDKNGHVTYSKTSRIINDENIAVFTNNYTYAKGSDVAVKDVRTYIPTGSTTTYLSDKNTGEQVLIQEKDKDGNKQTDVSLLDNSQSRITYDSDGNVTNKVLLTFNSGIVGVNSLDYGDDNEATTDITNPDDKKIAEEKRLVDLIDGVLDNKYYGQSVNEMFQYWGLSD